DALWSTRMRGGPFPLFPVNRNDRDDLVRPATAVPPHPFEIWRFRLSAADQRKNLTFEGRGHPSLGALLVEGVIPSGVAPSARAPAILAALGRPPSDYLPPDAAPEHLAAASSETLTWPPLD